MLDYRCSEKRKEKRKGPEMYDRFENCWSCGLNPRAQGDKMCAGCREKANKRNARAKVARQARDEAYQSCGLVKVRGAVSGKVYWE